VSDKREKKLAEWAGFELDHRFQGLYWNTQTKYWEGWPYFTTDLNACFKHLVPKALAMLIKEGYVPPIMKLFQLWYDELVSLTGDSSNVQQAALALCKAIEKQFGLEGGP